MPMRRIVFVGSLLVVLVSAGTEAQWLNYKTPGVPRTPDGKPRLDAPAPRAADGHPDLSGTWMHELTSVAEMRRLFGPRIDEAIQVDVPGMEIGTQHKYAFDILIDVTLAASPMRPATAALLAEQLRTRRDDLCNTGAPA